MLVPLQASCVCPARECKAHAPAEYHLKLSFEWLEDLRLCRTSRYAIRPSLTPNGTRLVRHANAFGCPRRPCSASASQKNALATAMQLTDATSGAFYFVSICANSSANFNKTAGSSGYAGVVALASLHVLLQGWLRSLPFSINNINGIDCSG